MTVKMNGLSRDLIIHPGETLSEILNVREMTNKDLAIRTGMSEKHISNVTRGLNPISTNLAKKLEYVLNIDASFWMNLQANYDNELIEYEEKNSISEEEFSIAKILRDFTKHLVETKLIASGLKKDAEVLELRKILNVSNLTAIPRLTIKGTYRASSKIKIDPYVLYAWQRLCEIKTENIHPKSELNVIKLKESIPTIRMLMSEDIDFNKTKIELTSLFSDCGIAFNIVKHFTGAPVQGFIKKIKTGKVILCMTIRQSFADIFWFTLFHEISHILNNDIDHRMIDYTFVKDEKEQKADRMAADFLIDPQYYQAFIANNDFSLVAIEEFSKRIAIPKYIIIGRLQNEERIPRYQYLSEKIKYKWAH